MSSAPPAGVTVASTGALWIVTLGRPGSLVQWSLEAGDLWILSELAGSFT